MAVTEPIEIVVVTSPACHLCDDAVTALAEVDDAVAVRVIDARSDEGRALIERHRPALVPLVVVDGSRFSVGRLPRGKLRRILEERSRG